MSVYIQSMEMPSCCMFCPVSNSVGCGLANPPIIMTSKEMLAGHPNWCPLVSVPEPHGDLIDREWLVDISLHLMNIAKNNDIANGVKWLWQYIIEAPTIIPASEEGEA